MGSNQVSDRYSFRNRRRAFLLSAALIACYVVAFIPLHHVLGRGSSSLSFLPVALIGWLFGLRAGVLASAVTIALNLFLYQVTGVAVWDQMMRSGMAAGSVALLVLGAVTGRMSDLSRRIREELAARRIAEEARERLVQELQSTLSEVRALSGLLPICASCKKIRDDQGYWQQVEMYVQAHSEAQFTHGFCPDCLEKLLAEINEAEYEAQEADIATKSHQAQLPTPHLNRG